MTDTDIEYFNPHTLVSNIRQAAIESGDLTATLAPEWFDEEEERLAERFSKLAYTVSSIADSGALRLVSAGEPVRLEAIDDEATTIEDIRSRALVHWWGDGASSFLTTLDSMERALQRQNDLMATLENILKMQAGVLLAAKEGVVMIAEGAVATLTGAGPLRDAVNQQNLTNALNSVASGVTLTGTLLALNLAGPFGIAAGLAAALGGALLTHQSYEGPTWIQVVEEVEAKLTALYDNYEEKQREIREHLDRLVTEQIQSAAILPDEAAYDGPPTPKNPNPDNSLYEHEEWQVLNS